MRSGIRLLINLLHAYLIDNEPLLLEVENDLMF